MKTAYVVKQYSDGPAFERGLNEGPGTPGEWYVEKYFSAFGTFTVVFRLADLSAREIGKAIESLEAVRHLL
jgi:hypothetical protein